MRSGRVRVVALCLECGLPNVFEGMESAVRAVCAQGTECSECGHVSPFNIISGYYADRGRPCIRGLPRTASVRRSPRVVDALPETTYGRLNRDCNKRALPSLSERDGDFD